MASAAKLDSILRRVRLRDDIVPELRHNNAVSWKFQDVGADESNFCLPSSFD